jgi:putative ABC transport system permease protein
MLSIGHDVRFAFRALRQRPAVTVTAIVALGLAIGSTTAIFSVVNAVLLKPLSFDDPDRVAILWESNPGRGLDIFSASPANFLDWEKQNTVFQSMSAYSSGSVTVTGIEESAERIQRAVVSEQFFNVVRTPPQVGRTLLPEDSQQGKDVVAVISHRYWQSRFGGDPSVIGKNILLDGRSYSIVGVMPAAFMYPADTDVWTPLVIAGSTVRGAHTLLAIGRLKDGATFEQADIEMKAIAGRLEQEYPQTNTEWTIRVFDVHQWIVRDMRPTLLVLLGAVGFVLLIACANVANLLLATASDRFKEIAVRLSLGAGRIRVLRQILTENIFLALAGGTFGTVLAWVGLRALLALAPANLPGLSETELSLPVLAFTVVLSLTTGILFGIFPATYLLRQNLSEHLKDTTRGSTGGAERHRLRSLLVSVEIALTIVVTAGAALMMQSLNRLHGVDPGFNPDNVLTVQLNLPASRYQTPEAFTGFIDRLLERVHALPGVTSAASTSTLPLTGAGSTLIWAIEGRLPDNMPDWPNAQIRWVTPRLFETLQIGIREGRDFTAQDRNSGAQTWQAGARVVVVNDAFARRAFPGESAIGKRIVVGGRNAPPTEIVGVVQNTQEADLQENQRALIYLPVLQSPNPAIRLVVKASADAAALAGPIRTEIAAIDKDLATFNVRTMDEVVGLSVARARFTSTLLAVFAIVALVLAAVGVYSVMAYFVSQRTKEVGIRIALGADNQAILKMVLRSAVLLCGVGVVLGLGGSFALTRVLRDMLFQVNPLDPIVLSGVTLMLLAVALCASLIPAHRATRVEPMTAIRYE